MTLQNLQKLLNNFVDFYSLYCTSLTWNLTIVKTFLIGDKEIGEHLQNQ